MAALEADFAALYSNSGRPSIRLKLHLRAMLLQAFYSVRSEQQLRRLVGGTPAAGQMLRSMTAGWRMDQILRTRRGLNLYPQPGAPVELVFRSIKDRPDAGHFSMLDL
ncbi:hypothetical protein [Prosthecomicrobium hirschii]|uniref:hypothetical protein n=1 Tax=Prosthecodimorpha hirschii TaxID=665126 RepID=UPI00221FF10E|nr:hypothetical protein [Prosthecomicrobium hirschii]MCW1842240.1 hypothetical protein [Prosthecomicrobium hirschii]